MKTRLLATFTLLLGLSASVGHALAQENNWRDLPPDERRQLRQQMREHWQQDKALRREDGDRHWRDVPPEERRRMREEMRDQRGGQVHHESHHGERRVR